MPAIVGERGSLNNALVSNWRGEITALWMIFSIGSTVGGIAAAGDLDARRLISTFQISI